MVSSLLAVLPAVSVFLARAAVCSATSMPLVAKYRGGLVRLPNPSEPCGGRKPAAKITDRAKRYRANSAGCRPGGARRCFVCRSRRNVGVHHLDGNEDNTRPSNLAWACKRCNTALGFAYKRAGVGKRTRQYNPRGRRRRRSPEASQYLWAVQMICRKTDQATGRCAPSNDKTVQDAVAIVRATPLAKRREYSRIAAAARGRYRSEVPF